MARQGYRIRNVVIVFLIICILIYRQQTSSNLDSVSTYVPPELSKIRTPHAREHNFWGVDRVLELLDESGLGHFEGGTHQDTGASQPVDSLQRGEKVSEALRDAEKGNDAQIFGGSSSLSETSRNGGGNGTAAEVFVRMQGNPSYALSLLFLTLVFIPLWTVLIFD